MTLRQFLNNFHRDQLVDFLCVIADKIPYVGKMLQDWAKATLNEVQTQGENEEIALKKNQKEKK